MRNPVAKDVDDYLATITWKEARVSLSTLRSIIREEIPNAKECISYGMPGYKVNGYICGFAAFKNHCSFFPGGIVPEFESELSDFKTSKGTIQFHPDKPIPDGLLRKILQCAAARDAEWKK
jgi:uncharacterized protein YdhG (YjbR/CyaY superfamily)